MKKLIIAALGLTLVLSGCAPKLDSNDKVVQKDDSKAETGIMTKNQISSNYYKPYYHTKQVNPVDLSYRIFIHDMILTN